MITFDPETHVYTESETGERIPSVTQIIEACFPYKKVGSYDGGDWYAQRGSAVHLAIHYKERGVLDPESVDDEIKPYLEAYEQFRKDFKYKTISSEEVVRNKAYGYCGTLDLRTRGAIWDYKTGLERYADAVQLAAYAKCISCAGVVKRFGVYLSQNGTYKIKEYRRNTEDWRVFLACKQIYDIKKKINWGNDGT